MALNISQQGYFGQDQRNSESYTNDIALQMTMGSSGAVPTSLTRNGGGLITSVVHGSTGVYVVTLNNAFSGGLIGICQNIMQASYSKSGACDVRVTAEAVATAATHTITLLIVDGDGDAVDPTTNDVVSVVFKLSYQTVT